MYKFVTLLFLLILGFCKEENHQNTRCPEELMCTEEFRSVTLNITDSNSYPVALDSYYSFNKLNGQIYNFDSNTSPGTYTILTDAQMGHIQREGSSIVFSGTINGQQINEEFVIGHNCCHIMKLSGRDEIIIPDKE